MRMKRPWQKSVWRDDDGADHDREAGLKREPGSNGPVGASGTETANEAHTAGQRTGAARDLKT
jgi:hypothetical protein